MRKYTNEGSDEIRECVGAATFKLMENNSFKDINVNEICNEAHIGRTTFYRYFDTKNGKLNALQFWLVHNWRQYKEKHMIREPENDKLFLNYLYYAKKKLLLLQRDGLIHLVDSIIFEIFDSNRDKDNIYLNYAGAGIWMGIVRAILQKEYADSPKVVHRNVHDGIVQLIMQKRKSKS